MTKNKNDEVVTQLYDKLYQNFVEEIDAVDNGVSLNEYPMKYVLCHDRRLVYLLDKSLLIFYSGLFIFVDLRYIINTAISRRVARLNPSWRDPHPDEGSQFQKALQLVGSEFIELVHFYASDWWEAYSVVKTAVDTRFEVSSFVF